MRGPGGRIRLGLGLDPSRMGRKEAGLVVIHRDLASSLGRVGDVCLFV
jgi:hypothetical protein